MSGGELNFHPVGPEDLEMIYSYTSKYGENSCQHSPICFFTLRDKYEDMICEEDGVLYVYRKGISDENVRKYLAPFGVRNDKEAFERLICDARSHGKKTGFYTLTNKAAQALAVSFPDLFTITKERDLSEYIFSRETMEVFPGKVHARRRTEIRSFWKTYGERAKALLMNDSDFEEVLAFARKWIEENSERNDRETLEREFRFIKNQIENYHTLKLSGTVIRIDGELKGFCYGGALNDDCYDVLIEKADRSIPGIYRVVRSESTKLNVQNYKYINFEEDVGVEGLRKVKESYGPEYMIDKYIATEK